jgi:acyl carrier protein
MYYRNSSANCIKIMPGTNISDDIVKMVAEYLDKPVSEVTPEKTVEELGIDSLDFAEIVFEVEEKCGIKAKGDMMELRARIHNLGDVIRLAEELVKEKESAVPSGNTPN